MACTSTVHGAGINTNDCTKANNEGNYTFAGYAELKPANAFGCSGLRLFLDGVDQGESYTFYRDAYVVSTTCPLPVPPEKTYDCINGACTPSTSGNGFFPSLSACQLACGKQGCSGQCVSSSDWAQIEGLISQLKNRSCG